jgi:hypothetical protein
MVNNELEVATTDVGCSTCNMGVDDFCCSDWLLLASLVGTAIQRTAAAVEVPHLQQHQRALPPSCRLWWNLWISSLYNQGSSIALLSLTTQTTGAEVNVL